jgi:hypothetical protein
MHTLVDHADNFTKVKGNKNLYVYNIYKPGSSSHICVKIRDTLKVEMLNRDKQYMP